MRSTKFFGKSDTPSPGHIKKNQLILLLTSIFGDPLPARTSYVHGHSSFWGTVLGKGIGPVSKIRNGVDTEKGKGKTKRCIYPRQARLVVFLSALHAAFSLRFFLIFRDKWCYRLSGKHAFFTTFPPALYRVFHPRFHHTLVKLFLLEL